MATTSNALPQLNIPASFWQLFKEICRGFFRNFFKNTLKALLATAFALYLPGLVKYIEEQNLLNSQVILFLKDFVIAPGNMLKGCLLSSAVILTVFSFINKVWMVGIFKSIGRFFGGGLSYLNIFRNSATSAFAWGLIIATAAGQFIENPLLSLTLIASGFMAGVVPQGSGLIYFARFFWNRFYATTVLKSGLKPADEFIRGTSAGFTLALVFKGIEAGEDLWLAAIAIIGLFLVIGWFRQRKAKVSEN